MPSSLYVLYDSIYKFYLFKWSHQFWSSQKIKAFSEINASERLKQIYREFVASIQNSPKSIYILDRRFIEYFVDDIQFFFDVRQITREDVLLLKKDLHLLLNEFERYALNGCFDTGNKVEIFLANIHFEANYYYVDTTNFKVTIMRSSAFDEFYSFDEVVFENLKNWVTFLKRTSTLISEGNVTERIRFFEQQRKLVDSM
jgi:hypothetical protein